MNTYIIITLIICVSVVLVALAACATKIFSDKTWNTFYKFSSMSGRMDDLETKYNNLENRYRLLLQDFQKEQSNINRLGQRIDSIVMVNYEKQAKETGEDSRGESREG